MSRSGYSYDLDEWALIRWRGAVKSAIRGRRGQKFLRELLSALDAMPEKRLICEDLRNEDGEVCTLGTACVHRGVDPDTLDPEDHEGIGKEFNIAPCLVQEIENENDEMYRVTPEERFLRMRKWIASELLPTGGQP